MKTLLLIPILLLIVSCAAGQAQTVGERIHEIEEVACPLTTVRNIERAVINALRLIPFFADWEPICSD